MNQKDHPGKTSVRWVIHFGNKYTMLQLENQSFDIHVYINFVHRQAKEGPSVIKLGKPTFKPLVFETDSKAELGYTLILCSQTKGDMQYYRFPDKDDRMVP